MKVVQTENKRSIICSEGQHKGLQEQVTNLALLELTLPSTV